MVQFPSGWVTHFGVDLATAYPPELGARFRYYQRLRPQPSFAAIVDRVLALDPEFKAHQIGELVRVVTREGEYAAWVAIEGVREGSRAMRYVGAVFVDEFATALDCIAIIPRHFAEVEQLSFEVLRSDTHELASRPRRFFYVPPLDWQAVPSGLTANWYPLDFPANRSNIVVPPATVVDDESRAIEQAFAQCGAGLEITSSTRDDITSANGTRGAYLRLQGRRNEALFQREMAMFVVGRYGYRMRLETQNIQALLELREIFHAVARSFRPLPSADELRLGRAFAAPSNVFDYWMS